MTIEIGECRFDSLRREVRRGTERVHLSPKAFELLGLLLDRRPRAVSKDELFTLLWPTTFVTEASLAGLVAEIRREIRDDAREPRYLRTVHGFGYAFSADGSRPAREEAVFRLIWGIREVALAGAKTSSAASPPPPCSSTTPPSRGITPASSWRAAGRASRTWAARTGHGSAAPGSPGARPSPTATTFGSDPSRSLSERSPRPRQPKVSESERPASPANRERGEVAE